MSGRSAYVRKQQVTTIIEHPLPEQLPLPHQPPRNGWQPDPYQRPPPPQMAMATAGHDWAPPQTAQQYVPALNIIDLDYERSPPLTVRPQARARANSSYTRSGTSMSWSSFDGTSHRPPTSRMRKSSFRAFIDSKSDSVRSKLTFRSVNRKPSLDQMNVRPGRSPSTARTPYSPYTPSSARGQAMNPSTLPQPRTPPDPVRMPPVKVTSEPGTTLPQGGTRYGEHLSMVKRWPGGGKPPQPWSKLRKDPEMWDPTGDTLVYLGHDVHGAGRPGPSLRVHSSVLEDTGSAFFTTILREGFLERHDFDLPISPQSPSPSPMSAMSEGIREVGVPRIDYHESDSALSATRLRTRLRNGAGSLHPSSGQPTPPTSESSLHDREHPVLYELFFPAPMDASTVENLRHHLTTRNVFALLFGKSLVGLNLYQSLLDLHERLQMYMPTESDNASLVIDHIVSHGLDDVRNDPASAAGLLAWSEGTAVRWREGWREAFVHCTGMYSRLKVVAEFRDVTHFSRVLLERASLEIQVRVQQVADRLADFDFVDMWPMQSVMTPPARDSFDRFRRFLSRHYERVFWSWPPLPRYGNAECWLTRDVITRLQGDFAALYDYLVDRDMTWDTSTAARDRQWRIISKGAKPNFRPDGDGLPMTDILVGFDNRHAYPHIPHPYPLLPPSQPLQILPKQARFGKKPRSTESRFAERRIALEYSEATNVLRLGPTFTANPLVEVFANFEKSDLPGEVDPAQARKGRWILIYAVLQALATVSVDTPGLRFTDKVPYFVNPRLRGTPPWRDKADAPPEEATHERSYCWTVTRKWEDSEFGMDRSGTRGHREVVLKGLGGDGTGRKWSVDHIDEDDTDQHAAIVAALAQKNRSRSVSVVHPGKPVALPNGTTMLMASETESREKVSDWPIRNQSNTRNRATATTASSDFIPPEDW